MPPELAMKGRSPSWDAAPDSLGAKPSARAREPPRKPAVTEEGPALPAGTGRPPAGSLPSVRSAALVDHLHRLWPLLSAATAWRHESAKVSSHCQPL